MTKFDLTFSLIDKEHGIAGHIEYSTDLFDRDTIERMAATFSEPIGGIAIDPDQPITTLPIMTEAGARSNCFRNGTTPQRIIRMTNAFTNCLKSKSSERRTP